MVNFKNKHTINFNKSYCETNLSGKYSYYVQELDLLVVINKKSETQPPNSIFNTILNSMERVNREIKNEQLIPK